MDQEKNLMATGSQLSLGSQEVIPVVHQEAEKRLGEAIKVGPNDVTGSSESQVRMKRARGRPRTYVNNFERINRLASQSRSFSTPLLVNNEKRARGRPHGSGKWQLLASSLGGCLAQTAGGNFTPHVFVVMPGQDVASHIEEFTRLVNNAVCVVSATGVVSSVVIHDHVHSNRYMHYEGRFEILTLKGSFTMAETNPNNGMLRASFAKPDGTVFGGVISGPLIASCPIQLVVGSFKESISKELKQHRQAAESSKAAENAANVGIESDQNKSNDVGTQNTCRELSSVVLGLPSNAVVPVNDQGKDQDLIDSVDPDDEVFEFPDPISTIPFSHF